MTQRRLEHCTHFSCGGQLSEDILKAGCIYFKRIEDGAAGTIARKKSRLARRSGCEAKGEAKEVTALIMFGWMLIAFPTGGGTRDAAAVT